ncbi:MAG: ABC transporter substrate-binding protein [Candidatus Pristimantibacillus sp.]
MRIKIRIGYALLISFIFIGFLALYVGYGRFGYSSSSGGQQQKSKLASNQPVKLKFGIWETQTDIQFWKEKVKQYSIVNPGVTVEVETIPDNNGQYLKVRMAASDLPDLFYLKGADLPFYKGSLLPLNDLNATGRNLYPAELDGEVLGLPLVSFSEYVYYHPSIFEEVGVEIPQTLDEFMDVLERIRSHGKYVPIAIGGKEEWTFYPFIEFGPPMIVRDEHYLSSISNKETPFGKDSAFEKSALMLKRIADHKLAGSDALAIGFDQATQLFQSNQAAMIALGQWYYTDYMSKEGSDKDLDAFALPWRNSLEEPLQAVTIPDQYMTVNKNSQNAIEAVQFLEWVFSPEVYQPYITRSQNSSTLTDVSSSLPFFDKVKANHPFEPFLYDGINQKFAIIKSTAFYDEKKRAQEIFSGASISEIQNEMNVKWGAAIQAINPLNPMLLSE